MADKSTLLFSVGLAFARSSSLTMLAWCAHTAYIKAVKPCLDMFEHSLVTKFECWAMYMYLFTLQVWYGSSKDKTLNCRVVSILTSQHQSRQSITVLYVNIGFLPDEFSYQLHISCG